MNTLAENCRRFFKYGFTSPAADIKYHGLMNQGATCYLNSVLQVLFMTKEFREAVERHTSENPDTECFELHLTNLFEDLKISDPVYTYKITQKLGIDNVYEHRDAAEYFEKILTSLTSPEASQIFQGQLTHKNKCSECGTDTDTDGPFWSLPLELAVSDMKDCSVVDGIDKYFRMLDVSGANQMYCDHCDAKSDATIKCVMKHHPEVLTLLLKRFKFDNIYKNFSKVRCSVDVPCTLQIPEDETYELYGFVDHFGDLRGGHYTATIKCQDDKRWYNFNDTMVTSLPDNQPFLMDNIMKSSTAYLLFYRKKTVKVTDTSQDIKEESANGDSQPDTSHSNEARDVKTRKRKEEDEEAEEGHHKTVEKPESKKKKKVDDQKAYNGLVNQGATSSLNSVLQVLFMTEAFREVVERHTSENPDAECFELHLTKLFEDLKSKNRVYNDNITKMLGIDNVYAYRDAAEYFEKIFTGLTSPEASQIFQGQLTHKNKCSKCGTETDTHGPSWSVPLVLAVSDMKDCSVVDGIDKYFRVLDVSGANQMYCDHCDAKSDATIKCVMKHHPEVLTLLLKRFKFGNKNFSKVRCSVDVPCTLQIPEDETYELYGFVDHFGDMIGEPYTATIKCQDDKRWYNFNDTMVTSLPDNQPFLIDNTMKSSRAHLLFYRKKTVKAANTSQDIKKGSANGGFQSDTSQSNKPCDVKTRKRKEDEEAEEGHHYTVGKQENKEKRKLVHQEGKQEQDSIFVDKQGDDVKVEKKSTTGADEREKASVSKKYLTKYDLVCGFPNNEGVDDSKMKMSNNQGISNSSPTRHEQQREEKRDVQKNKKQMTTEFEDAQMGDTSMTHQDNGKLGDDRHNEGVGDSKKNMSNNQGICNTSPTRHEKLREEKNDVKKDKEDMTREIKHTVTGDTSMTHQHSGKLGDVRQEQRSRQNSGLQLDYEENKGNEDIKEREINEVVYADNRRVDDKPVDEQEGKRVESRDSDKDRQQNRGEYECTQRNRMSGSHSGEGVEDKPQEQLKKQSEHRDVGVRINVEEMIRYYNRCIQNRKESFKQTGSAGSRDLTENQRVNSGQMTPCDEYKRQGNTTEERSELYRLKKNVMEGGGHPEKKVQITHSSIQNSKTNVTTETAGDTSGVNLSRQLSDDKSKDITTFDPKEEELDTLLEGVHNLKLSDSTPPGSRRGELDK